MIFRRLVALLSAASMLHLSVVAADAACAEHESTAHQGVVAPAAMAGHRMHDAVKDAPGMTAVSDASKAPCDAPRQPECCGAMTGCSVTGAVSRPITRLEVPRDAGSVRAARSTALASLFVAPEPPPPKA